MSIKKLLLIFEILVLLFFLFWHLQLGLSRYFDTDEFAHLHWGYSFSIGELPYRDFFYLFPPLFLYPVSFIFKIFGRDVTAIIASRIFIFVIFLATTSIIFLLVKKLRNSHVALLTVIVFAFLPLPFDKMIEVRPDLVATFLALTGLYLFIKGSYFTSGFFYGLSLGVIPKTIFFLLPVVLVLGYLSFLSHLSRKKEDRSLSFFPGFFAAGLLLLLTLIPFGDLPFSLYSMTKLASDVTKTLGTKFYMRPDIFFYPNDTFYGLPGVSPALLVNLLIYLAASIWAIHKFISSLSHPDNKKCLREFLPAATFWANFGAFVFFYPLKHSQYLIAVAPFIAFYFADLISHVFLPPPPRGSTKAHPRGVLALLALLIIISIIANQMNQRKLQWTNQAAFAKLEKVIQVVSSHEPIFDLTGETIFYKNGYYFCCLPYGQYIEAIGFRLVDIHQELKNRKTKYVYLGREKRLSEIPKDHALYIRENFIESATLSGLFVKN